MCVSRGHTLAATLGATQIAKTVQQQTILNAARMRHPLSTFASPNPDATPMVGMQGGALRVALWLKESSDSQPSSLR